MRSVRFLATLEPVFDETERFVGITMKPTKCEVMLIRTRGGAAAHAEIAGVLASVSESRGAFLEKDLGRHLGIFLGPCAGEQGWCGPKARWEEIGREMVGKAMLAGALAAHSTRREALDRAPLASARLVVATARPPRASSAVEVAGGWLSIEVSFVGE